MKMKFYHLNTHNLNSLTVYELLVSVRLIEAENWNWRLSESQNKVPFSDPGNLAHWLQSFVAIELSRLFFSHQPWHFIFRNSSRWSVPIFHNIHSEIILRKIEYTYLFWLPFYFLFILYYLIKWIKLLRFYLDFRMSMSIQLTYCFGGRNKRLDFSRT